MFEKHAGSPTVIATLKIDVGKPKPIEFDVLAKFEAGALRHVMVKPSKGEPWIEVVCVMANALLISGAWTEDDLISAWVATHTGPEGVCCIQPNKNTRPVRVLGILDAAAKWLRSRRTP